MSAVAASSALMKGGGELLVWFMVHIEQRRSEVSRARCGSHSSADRKARRPNRIAEPSELVLVCLCATLTNLKLAGIRLENNNCNPGHPIPSLESALSLCSHYYVAVAWKMGATVFQRWTQKSLLIPAPTPKSRQPESQKRHRLLLV